MPIETKPTKEAGGSMNDHIEMVQTAWRRSRDGEPGPYTYVMDVFPDAAVVCWGGYDTPKRRYYRIGYTATDDGVVFADENDWQEVTLSYVPASSGDSDSGDLGEVDTVSTTESNNVLLESERALVEATSKGLEAVIVVEGESYHRNVYSKAALKSGISVFSGKPVYADHPSFSEEEDRPERSIRDRVGSLGEAYVGKDKQGRTALRAPLRLSKTADWLTTLVNEGHVKDMSIRATGKGQRDKDGRFIVESFADNPHTSVDFVTVASAGGYAELFESIGFWKAIDKRTLQQHRPDLVEELSEVEDGATIQWLKESRMTPEEIQKIQESNNTLLEENTKLFRQVRKTEAMGVIESLPALKGLPKEAVDRVKALLTPVVEAYGTHGSQQTVEQFTAEATKVAESEKTYITKLMPHGVVRGLGESTTTTESSRDYNKEIDDELTPLLSKRAQEARRAK